MYYDDTDPDHPLTERDLPSPKDVYDSFVADERDVDLGWMFDRHWSLRRTLITALILLAVLGFVLISILGVLQLVFGPPAPTPTPFPLPRI